MRPSHSASGMHVTLCLARGLSKHICWILRSTDSPQVLTIGSSASCDWQIQAPGVADHALSVAFIQGALCVASGPDALVTCDGIPLRETWRELTHSTRLKLGSAEIEVICQCELSEHEQGVGRERWTLPYDPQPSRSRTATQHRSARPPLYTTLLGSESAAPRQHGPLLRAASFVLLTAIAYTAWLSLLDQL